jgi:hypothetical protein
LPPSSAAAKFYVLWVYLQVQEWLFNPLDPETYGWKKSNGRLIPVYTDRAIAPDNLIKRVSCGCKTGCSNERCGCVRLKLPCNPLCKCGDSCVNVIEQDSSMINAEVAEETDEVVD